jgi:hypothetical protein
MSRVTYAAIIALALTACQQTKLSNTPAPARVNYSNQGTAGSVRPGTGQTGVIVGGGGGTIVGQPGQSFPPPTPVPGGSAPPTVYPIGGGSTLITGGAPANGPTSSPVSTGGSGSGITSTAGGAPAASNPPANVNTGNSGNSGPGTTATAGGPGVSAPAPGGSNTGGPTTVTAGGNPTPAQPTPVAITPSSPNLTNPPAPPAPLVATTGGSTSSVVSDPGPSTSAVTTTTTAAAPVLSTSVSNGGGPIVQPPQNIVPTAPGLFPQGKIFSQAQAMMPAAPIASSMASAPSQRYSPPSYNNTTSADCRSNAQLPACQMPWRGSGVASASTSTASAPVATAAAATTPAAGSVAPAPQSLDTGCSDKVYSKEPNKDIDILIVMDTSASMRGGTETGNGGELGKLIPKMSAFVDQLPTDANVRIGMILGHGPGSEYHGKLYTVAGDTKDPEVIDYNDLKAHCQGDATAVRKCVNDKAAAILRNKLKSDPDPRKNHLPVDHSDAQGEALFLSLYDSITKPELLHNMMKRKDDKYGNPHGLLRKDATLVVIFLSDEQEVCFDYSQPQQDPNDKSKKVLYRPVPVEVWEQVSSKKGKAVFDWVHHEDGDPHEKRTFDTVCKLKELHGRALSHGDVWDALLKLKGGKAEKLVINGVHYIDNNIPVSLLNQCGKVKCGEMEAGHGYLELETVDSPGAVANMANVDRLKPEISMESQMAYLGKFTNQKVIYQQPFACESNVHPDAIDMRKVEMDFVDSSQNRVVAKFHGSCVDGQSCGSFAGGVYRDTNATGAGVATDARFKVDPDLLTKTLEAGGFKQGFVRIRFDSDPNSGNINPAH